MSFIDDHDFPVGLVPRVLNIASSTYYDWHARAAAPSRRRHREAELLARIEAIRHSHEFAPDLWVPAGVAPAAPTGCVPLTQARGAPHARERISPGAPTQRLEARLHPAESRSQVGARPDGARLHRRCTQHPLRRQHHLPTRARRPLRLPGQRDRPVLPTRAELVINALQATQHERGCLAEALPHTDHDPQYTSAAFTAAYQAMGVSRSMGAVGSSADNAAIEAFHATLKHETLHRHDPKRWPSPQTARLAVFSWITRYNTRRRHSTIDYLSPITYKQKSTSLQPTT